MSTNYPSYFDEVAVDNENRPLTGGFWKACYAGTFNPAPTYNSAGILNPVNIPINIYGRYQMRLDTSIVYDLYLYAPTDTVNALRTYPNVYTGSTGGVGLQGPQGEKGDKGDTGATGATGAQGENGLDGAQGEKGDKGDKGDTGVAGINYLGDWVGSTTYVERDVVRSTDGNAYYCQVATADVGVLPQDNPTDWSLFVMKGATGDKGDKGDKGDTGATGATGADGAKGDTGDTAPLIVAPVLQTTGGYIEPCWADYTFSGFLTNWLTASISHPDWDATYGRFTASVAGNYLVTFMSQTKTSTSASQPHCGVQFLKNGVNMCYIANTENIGTPAFTTNELTGSMIIHLEVGDNITFASQRSLMQLYQTKMSIAPLTTNVGIYDTSRTIYVSNKGNDGQTGKCPSIPKLTLASALNDAKAGQMAEGNVNIWTVVCQDTSIFNESGLYIPPSISVYAPNASLIGSSYLAIPEGTNFTFAKVTCDNGYTTGTRAGVITNIDIKEYTYTGNSDYGFITTGGYASIVNVNIGTIHGTASSQSGSGVIGCVSDGGASTMKYVTFNVNTIKLDQTSYSGSPRSVLWNNAPNTNIVFNIGSIFAPHMQYMYCNVGSGTMHANVGYSETEHMAGIFSASVNTITGGFINCLAGSLGQLENGPALKVNADFNGTAFVIGVISPTLELSRPGQISIKGSDLPAHLKDKLVAGDGVEITEVSNQLVISANGDASMAHFSYTTGADINGAFYVGGIRGTALPTSFYTQMMMSIDSDVCTMTALLEFFGESNEPKVTILRHTGRSDGRETTINFKHAIGATNGKMYVKVITALTGYSYTVTLTSLDTLQSDATLIITDTSYVSEADFTTPNLLRYDVLNSGVGIDVTINNRGERTINTSPSSAGVASYPAPEWTSAGTGMITMSSCYVYLYDNANFTGNLIKYYVPEATFTLTDGTDQLVVANYNGGTPIYALVTTTHGNYNSSSIIPVYRFWRVGSTVHSASIDSLGIGLAAKIARRISSTDYYERINQIGLSLSEDGSRHVGISSAGVYGGAVYYDIVAFASATNNLISCESVTGIWTYTQNALVYRNDVYNPTAGFATLGNNKYTVKYFYRSIGDAIDAFVVTSASQYNTVSEAEADRPRTDLPSVINGHCMLVGRIIIQKGASSGVVEQAFGNVFASGGGSGSGDTYKVAVNSTDVTPDYLEGKVEAGSNVTLATIGGKVRISASASSTPSLYSMTMPASVATVNQAIPSGSTNQWIANATMMITETDQAISNSSEFGTICPQVATADYIFAIYKYVSGGNYTLVASTGVNAIPASPSWITATLTNIVESTLVAGTRYYYTWLWNGNSANLMGVYGNNQNFAPYISWYKANMGVLTSAPSTITPDGEQGQRFFFRVRT